MIPGLRFGSALSPGRCPCAALWDVPGGCVPPAEPPGAVGPSPRPRSRAGAGSHCPGPCVTVVALTPTSAGVRKLSRQKLLSLGAMPALHVPRNMYGVKFCMIPLGAGGPAKLVSAFPSAFPTFHISPWLSLMWSLGSTKIKPLCRDGNIVHTQAFYTSST